VGQIVMHTMSAQYFCIVSCREKDKIALIRISFFI